MAEALPTAYFVILIVLGIPFYFAFHKLMFSDFEDFMDSVRYYLKPNLISMLRGEGLEDSWAAYFYRALRRRRLRNSYEGRLLDSRIPVG